MLSFDSGTSGILKLWIHIYPAKSKQLQLCFVRHSALKGIMLLLIASGRRKKVHGPQRVASIGGSEHFVM